MRFKSVFLLVAFGSHYLYSKEPDVPKTFMLTIMGIGIFRATLYSSLNLEIHTFRNGSLLATTCKDKKLRLLDPRTGEIVQQGSSHQGTKASKVAYIGNTGTLFTTGFSKFSDRQLAVWSENENCL